MSNIYEQYPWLNFHASEIADYIPPDYYNRILKEYSFGSATDLDIFRNFLTKRPGETPRSLELGPGSGRATQVFLQETPEYHSLDLVDLSPDMIRFGKDRFSEERNLNFVHSDTIDYLAQTDAGYDLVYSLWSFSHSIHQHLIRDPRNESYVSETIAKFISENMNSGSRLFIIHFDSESEEQTILFRQWKKEFQIFADVDSQTPSKHILDRVFKHAESQGLGTMTVTHLEGDPIPYASINEALEIFMNFHMETYFNLSENVAQIVAELSEDLTRHATEDGIFVKPGCFIYTFEKQ